MQLRKLLAALAALCCCAATESYQIKEGKVSVIGSSGSIKYGHTFYKNADSEREAAVPLDELDTLKLYFVVDLPEGGSAPKQLSVVFASVADPLKSLIVPLRLRAQNRVRYEVDLASPPAGFLPLGEEMTLRLLVASPAAADTPSPLDLRLGLLRLSPSLTAKGVAEKTKRAAAAPAEWHVERYGRQPDVEWTFPAGEKAVPAPFAAAATAIIVGAPWLFLLGLLSRLRPRLPYHPQGLSAQTAAFLGLLGSFLLLALAYFIQLRIFAALGWLSGLALVASFVGRGALTERQHRRLAVKASKVE